MAVWAVGRIIWSARDSRGNFLRGQYKCVQDADESVFDSVNYSEHFASFTGSLKRSVVRFSQNFYWDPVVSFQATILREMLEISFFCVVAL